MSEKKRSPFLSRLRRVRVRLVLLTCLLVFAAGTVLALYRDRDLLRDFAVAELRQVLEREAGLDFSFREARVRVLPPRVELRDVKVEDLSRAWVMDAERVEVSATIYALFFGRPSRALWVLWTGKLAVPMPRSSPSRRVRTVRL